MFRRFAVATGALSLSLIASLAPAQEAAQEEASVVRMSYWQVDYADLDDWNQAFATHVAPVLRTMQEEGAIQGFSTWEHNAGGGPYNWRLALRFYEGANVTETVQDFVNRITERAGAETFARIQRMIRRHEDQIWQISDAWFVEDAEPPDGAHYYVADFQMNPIDVEAWNAFYREVWKPALISAAEAGQLGGFVALEHLHGGPYNWQMILFAPDWDSLDDVWNAAFQAFGEQEARFTETLGMIRAHDDGIWVEAEPPEEEGSME